MKTLFGCFAVLFVVGVAHADMDITNASNRLIVACDSSTLISAGNGVTKIISGAPNKRIYICDYSVSAQNGASFQFRYGAAGSTCATGVVGLTGNIASISSTTLTMGGGLGTIFQPSPPGNEFCINNSASGNLISGFVTWTQL